MHERTIRLLCRLGFLLLALLPTLVLATGISVVRSGLYRAAQKAVWERRLAEELGLLVTLDRVSYPTRGISLLEGLELRDPETQARVARLRQVELGSRGSDLIVSASQPELQGDQIWRLWDLIHERLLRGEAASTLRVQLLAGEATIHRASDPAASTLTGVRCRLAPSADGPQVAIEFRDVALQMVEPAQLWITRNRNLKPPATRWELDTHSTALPCSLLADQIPVLDWLGERALFQGRVRVTQIAAGWEGDLTGRFQDVDLDRLVTDHYQHKLSGLADVVFRQARFRDGALIDAAGDLACSGGQVGWSLLDQAEKTLNLSADARVRAVTANSSWTYSQLRFDFALSRDRLTLRGRCDAAQEGLVMTDRSGPLLVDRLQEIPPVALVRFLTDARGDAVPATAEAYQLLHVLPIAAESRSGTLGRRPVKLRLQSR